MGEESARSADVMVGHDYVYATSAGGHKCPQSYPGPESVDSPQRSMDLYTQTLKRDETAGVFVCCHLQRKATLTAAYLELGKRDKSARSPRTVTRSRKSVSLFRLTLDFNNSAPRTRPKRRRDLALPLIANVLPSEDDQISHKLKL